MPGRSASGALWSPCAVLPSCPLFSCQRSVRVVKDRFARPLRAPRRLSPPRWSTHLIRQPVAVEAIRHTLRYVNRGDGVGGYVLGVEHDQIAGVGGRVIDVGDQPARATRPVIRGGEDRLAGSAPWTEFMPDDGAGPQVVAEQGSGYAPAPGRVGGCGMPEAVEAARPGGRPPAGIRRTGRRAVPR